MDLFERFTPAAHAWVLGIALVAVIAPALVAEVIYRRKRRLPDTGASVGLVLTAASFLCLVGSQFIRDAFEEQPAGIPGYDMPWTIQLQYVPLAVAAYHLVYVIATKKSDVPICAAILEGCVVVGMLVGYEALPGSETIFQMAQVLTPIFGVLLTLWGTYRLWEYCLLRRIAKANAVS